eukprot:TRINITY_DN9476_c0_g1_i1.p1 TRINITY_DN9476_c0_g1~~TRINITY_DN9476_c0_g1_i1.p1  ORF type:complete len:144 (-),score=29.68 TRINITY_DN9476_c0_g1_i1:138-569(-)
MKRGLYREYTTINKVEVVQRCQGRSLREVAKEYDIPVTTLQGWKKKYDNGEMLTKGKKRTKGGGRHAALDEEVENELADWIIRLRMEGKPITKKMLKELALNCFEGEDSGNFKASNMWLKGFLTRRSLTINEDTKEIVLARFY